MHDTSAAIAAARQALRRNDPVAAVATLEAAMADAPDCPALLECLGIALWSAGRRKEALHALDRAAAADRSRPSAHYNYALVLAAEHQVDEALEEVDAALYLSPAHSGARALREHLSRRIRYRQRTSEEGFEVRPREAAPGQRVPGAWSNLECRSCGARNLVTARTCARCGSRLPEEDETVFME